MNTPFDTSNLVKDSGGMIKTGEFSSIDANSLDANGYKMATNYANSQNPITPSAPPPTKPVTSLSTTSAVNTVNKNLGALNTMSPTTAPGYKPPAPPTTPITPPVEPKAFFTNSQGQEAEFTKDQLNDPANQKFLTNNGYVQTRTEGPSFDPSASLRTEIQTTSDRIQKMVDDFTNFNVDSDPTFANQANSIRSQYDVLKQAVVDQEAVANRGIQLATSRYSPTTENSLLFSSVGEANASLAKINATETNAITTARTAYQTGKFTQFTDTVNQLQKIRDDKAKVLTDYNTNLTKIIDNVKKTTIQASRDSAIAGLVGQGVTDPSEILNYLNFDDKGNSTGDFTAKEVGDALKNLAPAGELDKLTGSTKDFFILKAHGQLPSSITSLPDDQQLFAYLKAEHAATVSPTGAGGTFSLSDVINARKNGLDIPMSVVGLNQKELEESLSSPTPPAWFVERLINGATNNGMNATVASSINKANSPVVQKAWDQWKQDNEASLGQAGGP